MTPKEPSLRIRKEAGIGSGTESHGSSLGWSLKAVGQFHLIVQHPEYRFGSGQLQSLNEP